MTRKTPLALAASQIEALYNVVRILSTGKQRLPPRHWVQRGALLNLHGKVGQGERFTVVACARDFALHKVENKLSRV